VKRKVCVITGTRAEYGLLRWVMEGICASSKLELQVIATGMHLSPEFGLTYREIEKDGLPINRKVELLLSSDTPVGIAKSIGLGVIGFADAFAELQPDLIVVLGDRFEILAAVSAALPARIPVAHLHGGELTEGAMDESIRHAITKMAHLHFVATEEYRRRVIQMGEMPERVFLVGGLGIDNIHKLKLLDRTALEASLGFRLGRKNLLVTFHPETLTPNSAEQQLNELLAALDTLEDTHILFTMPNADTESRKIIQMIEQFVETHPNCCVYQSLGQLRYLSCLCHFDAIVGNSSSGLTEAPSFRIGTINIGDRQKGRLKAASVIDCPPQREAIRQAIATLYIPQFQRRLQNTKNPYGEGGASERVVAILEQIHPQSLLRKRFHDLS